MAKGDLEQEKTQTLSTEQLDASLQTPLKPGDDPTKIVPPSPPATPPATTTPPEAPAKPDTPAAAPQPAPKPGEAPAKEPAAATPPAATPPGKAPAAEQPKLLAGKYKTSDELVKGVLNAAKKLPKSDDLAFYERVTAATAEAKKSGDWKPVEDLYAELNTEISKTEKPPATKPAAEAPKPDAETARKAQVQEAIIMRYALEQTLEEIHTSKLAQELVELELPLPEKFLVDEKVTDEYMRQLKRESSADWFELRSMIEKRFRFHHDDAKQVQKASTESDTHNTTIRQADEQKIRDYAAKVGYKIEEEALKTFLDDAQKVADLFEDKYGSPYLRANALYNHWIITNHEALTEQSRLTGELTGRTQHTQDLKDMGTKGPKTIGSSDLPATRRDAQPKIDVTDEKQRQALSSEKLDELIAKGVPE